MILLSHIFHFEPHHILDNMPCNHRREAHPHIVDHQVKRVWVQGLERRGEPFPCLVCHRQLSGFQAAQVFTRNACNSGNRLARNTIAFPFFTEMPNPFVVFYENFSFLCSVTLMPVFDIALKSPKSRRHQGFYFVKRLAIGDLYPPVRYRGFKHAGAASPRPPSALAALTAFALHAARSRAGRTDRNTYAWYVTCRSIPEKENPTFSSAGR